MSASHDSHLPLSPEAVTTQWLTSALAERYPGTVVSAASVEEVRHGTASKIRLKLDYNEAGVGYGIPSRLCAKGGFRNAEQRALLADSYRKEVSFYRDVSPRLPPDLERARCYFTGVDESTHQAIVLLEDLGSRGAEFGDPTRPASIEIATRTVEWLAMLHGHTWNKPITPTLAAYPGVIEPVIMQLLQPEIWNSCISRPLAAPVPKVLRDAGNLRKAFAAMWEQAHGTLQCCIHGDTHLGNMYFLPDGTLGFLDWQTQMRGPALDDFTYFIAGALTIDDRRKHERDLLRHYLDRLSSHGVPVPSFDQAFLTYRQQAFHGLMWVATPSYMQPDEIVAAFVERYCAAVNDLESLRAVNL